MTELDALGAWSPDRAPTPDEILTPPEHRNALDLDRTLIVGNRGVGKTFWSQALVDPVARKHVATLYPRLGLENVEAVIGFSGGYSSGFTASERTISEAEKTGADSVRIWEAVLLRFLAPRINLDVGLDLKAVASWLQHDAERGEKALRQADIATAERGRFLLIFDGLDALGESWPVIRQRLDGLVKFARLARSFRAIRIKIFLRLDQAEDRSLWESPDASKLYNERVRLRWDHQALYDLLFFHLRRRKDVQEALERLAPQTRVVGDLLSSPSLEQGLGSMEIQRAAFTALAGASMGGGTNRGNTYNWVVNHLADAHGETTPRAFLVALAQAAKHPPASRGTVIDHLGIQAGVSEASERRLSELQEDYWWIQKAFDPLAQNRVPCEPRDFLTRWSKGNTVRRINDRAKREKKLPPIALDAMTSASKEEALLGSLKLIGVVEERSNGKINMPDIFRVAANIKRMGGVKPPPRTAVRRR